MISDESIQQSGGLRIAAFFPENEARFSVLASVFKCLHCATRQHRHSAKDDGAIRVSHVPARPLDVPAGGRFLEGIAGIDMSVLGFPALRTPPAVSYAICNGPVQRRPIGASLAAGNDFKVMTSHVRNNRSRIWQKDSKAEICSHPSGFSFFCQATCG
jgi:hypothetical protein